MRTNIGCVGKESGLRQAWKCCNARPDPVVCMGNNDLWIASHARANKLILVTNHVVELESVPGLRVENWVDQSQV